MGGPYSLQGDWKTQATPPCQGNDQRGGKRTKRNLKSNGNNIVVICGNVDNTNKTIIHIT